MVYGLFFMGLVYGLILWDVKRGGLFGGAALAAPGEDAGGRGASYASHRTAKRTKNSEGLALM